jgi:hypothetical protein
MTRVRRSVPVPAEQMIAALIPAPLPRDRPPRSPLPQLPAPRAGPDHVEPYLDVGRLDPSGRVSARPLLHRLGWPPGHRIQFDIAHGAVTATSSPAAGVPGPHHRATPGRPVRQVAFTWVQREVGLVQDPFALHDQLLNVAHAPAPGQPEVAQRCHYRCQTRLQHRCLDDGLHRISRGSLLRSLY